MPHYNIIIISFMYKQYERETQQSQHTGITPIITPGPLLSIMIDAHQFTTAPLRADFTQDHASHTDHFTVKND